MNKSNYRDPWQSTDTLLLQGMATEDSGDLAILSGHDAVRISAEYGDDLDRTREGSIYCYVISFDREKKTIGLRIDHDESGCKSDSDRLTVCVDDIDDQHVMSIKRVIGLNFD